MGDGRPPPPSSYATAGRYSVHARNTNIVSELFSRLNELSDAISPRATSGVKSEVDRVFTGGRGRGTRTNAVVPPVRVNPTQTDGLASTSSTSSIEGNPSGCRLPFPPQRAFAMRHNFPSSFLQPQANIMFAFIAASPSGRCFATGERIIENDRMRKFTIFHAIIFTVFD